MRGTTVQILDIAPAPADAASLVMFYRRMVLIRAVESALLDMFAKGRVRGTVHTCLGQEAVAVGVIGALDTARDVVCSNHRGHGHYLAWCDDVEGLVAEIMGRPEGACGGLGGSQHLVRGNFYANGILGGMSPVAAGIAFAERAKGSDAVTTVFHGDGAMAEGAVMETMNLAALWNLPLLFVVEANGYAQSTPIAREIAGRLVDRGRAFAIPTAEVDGNDVLTVHDEAARLVGEVRAGDGPRLLICHTYRLGPHSKGDDDRDAAEIEAAFARCPIARAGALLDAAARAEAETEAAQRVAAALARFGAGTAG